MPYNLKGHKIGNAKEIFVRDFFSLITSIMGSVLPEEAVMRSVQNTSVGENPRKSILILGEGLEGKQPILFCIG